MGIKNQLHYGSNEDQARPIGYERSDRIENKQKWKASREGQAWIARKRAIERAAQAWFAWHRSKGTRAEDLNPMERELFLACQKDAL